MKTLYLILLIVAAVLFAVAIFLPTPVAGTDSAGRPRGFHLVAAGLLAWVLVPLIKQFDLVTD